MLAGVRYQTIDDRLSAAAGATIWSHRGAEWVGSTSLEWRSRVRHEGNVVLARAGASLASEGTPLLSWNGAGSGHGREELLRAHPLLHDGVIRDAVFGRGLISGGVEWRRWGAPFKRVLRFAPAVFVDGARAHDVPEFADPAGTSTPALGCAWPCPARAFCGPMLPSGCAMESGLSQSGGCDSARHPRLISSVASGCRELI